MYKCLSCLAEFDEPKINVETCDGFNYPPFREWYCCPHCGDTEYGKIVAVCANCNNNVSQGEIVVTVGNDVYCANCYEEIII